MSNQHHQQQRPFDDDETDDYGYDRSAAYATNKTPQQLRQEERAREQQQYDSYGFAQGQKANKKKSNKKIILGTIAALVLIAVAAVLA
ncbi:hypothetical protein BGW38_004834, partial [Lunasporangiospora selenospora]